jgi:ABC-type glutathione transport system ATPase component
MLHSSTAKALEKARNFVYNDCTEGGQSGCLTRKDRHLSLKQKGITLWMTGLSGSGKSTIGKALENYLVKKLKKHTYVQSPIRLFCTPL